LGNTPYKFFTQVKKNLTTENQKKLYTYIHECMQGAFYDYQQSAGAFHLQDGCPTQQELSNRRQPFAFFILTQ
jgi:hypothetical protein